MSWKALFLYIMSMCDENITNLSASYWKYSKLLYIRTLIKPSYQTSSVEVVHSQVIFFYDNTQYIVVDPFFLTKLLFYFFSFVIVLVLKY